MAGNNMNMVRPDRSWIYIRHKRNDKGRFQISGCYRSRTDNVAHGSEITQCHRDQGRSWERQGWPELEMGTVSVEIVVVGGVSGNGE